MLEMRRHLRRRRELAAEILVDVAHRVLEAADRALGDFGRGDQFADRGLQRVLVGFQPLQPLVEHDAIGDREQQQDRHQALDRYSHDMAHCASNILVCSSAFSNMASVVFGLRNCLVTRIATRSPTRPILPSVSVTLPQRTVTSASAFISSGSVSPTFSCISCFSGMAASYSKPSTEISACASSVAEWASARAPVPDYTP